MFASAELEEEEEEDVAGRIQNANFPPGTPALAAASHLKHKELSSGIETTLAPPSHSQHTSSHCVESTSPHKLRWVAEEPCRTSSWPFITGKEPVRVGGPGARSSNLKK